MIKYKWYLGENYVNGRGSDKKLVRLHRYVLQYFGKDCVDHINNDTLDNRISNLRIVTTKQNSMNKSSKKGSSSQYVGVSFDKKSKKWKAEIRVNNKKVYLGSFNSEFDAAKRRD